MSMDMGSKPKILILGKLWFSEEDLKIMGEVADVLFVEEDDEDKLVELARDATVLISDYVKITRRMIEAGSGLRGLITYGVGYDQIDVEAASERGVYVVNCPGVNSQSVAELTICHILNLLRNLCRCDALVRGGGWTTSETGKFPEIFTGQEFYGKTLGIVGLGAIGRVVARLAKAFGVRVLATDPHVSKERAEALGVELVDLERVMREADIVTVHVPLLPSTRGLIGEREIGMMKPTAYLINTSRGAVIDEDALIKALQEGRIAGAGLDVFTKEPIPPDNPLLRMENVTLTPHMGGVTGESIIRTAKTVAQEAARMARGEPPKTIVNRAQLEEKGYQVP